MHVCVLSAGFMAMQCINQRVAIIDQDFLNYSYSFLVVSNVNVIQMGKNVYIRICTMYAYIYLYMYYVSKYGMIAFIFAWQREERSSYFWYLHKSSFWLL